MNLKKSSCNGFRKELNPYILDSGAWYGDFPEAVIVSLSCIFLFLFVCSVCWMMYLTMQQLFFFLQMLFSSLQFLLIHIYCDFYCESHGCLLDCEPEQPLILMNERGLEEFEIVYVGAWLKINFFTYNFLVSVKK